MGIIKTFRLFRSSINENVYKPYVSSLKNLNAYRKFSEWAEVRVVQQQDGKCTKITVYPNGKDETVLKYEIREMPNGITSSRMKLAVYEFKDFEWEYVMGYWVSGVSDYENMFTAIEKMALKELYDLDISHKNFLSSPKNLEPVDDCVNPDLMASLISRIPDNKVISYFKNNPLDLYILDDCPEIKKEIMTKAKIGDHSLVGRALKNNLL